MKPSLLLIVSIALCGVAHAQIDRSAGALLERSSSRYRRLKSFHTTATTVSYGLRGSTRSRIALSYQSLQRASVVVSWLDNKGQPSGVLSRQLLGADFFYTTFLDTTADVFPIGTSADRDKFLNRIESSSARLGLVVMSFAEPEELDPKTGKRRVTLDSLAKEGKLRSMTMRKVGASTQVRITLMPPKSQPKASPIILIYNLNSRTLFLESFHVEMPTPGKKTRTAFIATYSPPVSNWKGSQALTDQLVYNWNVVAPHVAHQSTAKPTISVEPTARTLFARATTLYGNLKTWRLKWRGTSGEALSGPSDPENKTIVFDRAGRLRVEDSDSLTSLTVIDGKNYYVLDTSDLDVGKPAKYSHGPMTAQYGDTLDVLSFGSESAQLFAGLLKNNNPLLPKNVQLQVKEDHLRVFTAKVLPSQQFNGESCDIVRLTTRFLGKTTARSGETIEQRTFWFARTDGRLVRWQTRSVEGTSRPTTSDAQVQTQQFNPTLSDQEFTFTPPKGALLSK